MGEGITQMSNQARIAFLLANVCLASSLPSHIAPNHHRRQQVLAPQANGLLLNVYDNSVLFGDPIQSSIVDSLDFSFSPQSFDFSAEVLGELTIDANAVHAFSCEFEWTAESSVYRQLTAFVWLDDHLVCQTGVFSLSADRTDYTLQPLSRTILPVRIHFTAFNIQPSDSNPPPNIEDSQGTVSLRVRMAKNDLTVKRNFSKLPMTNMNSNGRSMALVGGDIIGTLTQCFDVCDQLASRGCIGFSRDITLRDSDAGSCQMRQNALSNELCASNIQQDSGSVVYLRVQSCAPPLPIEPLRLSPTVSTLETSRRELQQNLTVGWGPWTQKNILEIINLPSGSRFNIGICQLSSGNCDTNDGAGGENSRVGLHAYDRSYVQMYIGTSFGGNVSVEYSSNKDSLLLLITPVPGNSNNPDYSIQLTPSFAYGWGGGASVTNTTLTFAPSNLTTIVLHCTSTSPTSPTKLPGSNVLEHRLADGALACSTGAVVPVADTAARLLVAQMNERNRLNQYGGDLAATKEAMQAGLMWNWLYVPCEYGPFVVAGRGWSFTGTFLTTDFNYAVFDWDNIFSSYMLSLDAKDLAYSNMIQIIKAKTCNGFVPNYSAGGLKSQDRTEPPIGAKVLLEMYNKYHDTWIVEYLFDDLLDWVTWYRNSRRLLPLNITTVGSGYIPRYTDSSAETMQGAKYESGMDNSPMYDADNLFDAKSGLVQLYDVGMGGLEVMELRSLAELALVIDHVTEAAMLNGWADELAKAVADNLWDEEGQVFTNKFPSGEFYRRISPTSFYPLAGRIATDTQASVMVSGWLLNKTRFCISPTGDYSGNTNDCYWGLPSINAQDSAYPSLGYWRGYIWGPMALITYWGLQQYKYVPIVATAMKALARQMRGLLLSQWYPHHHVCENFSPYKNATECTGSALQSWGGLTGFLSFLEQGHYYQS
eukprot:c2923_g1_i1.p1 GENE.c2923_g1_i1~~c2923_g1_i1.p1  ORF type:complete len:932 (-),score=169.29 c2923_g1_i1:264-3059(-)